MQIWDALIMAVAAENRCRLFYHKKTQCLTLSDAFAEDVRRIVFQEDALIYCVIKDHGIGFVQVEKGQIDFIFRDAQGLTETLAQIKIGVMSLHPRAQEYQYIQVIYRLFTFCCGTEQISGQNVLIFRETLF